MTKPLSSPVTFISFISVDFLPEQDSVQHNLGLYDFICFADKDALMLQPSEYYEYFIACLCPDLSIFT